MSLAIRTTMALGAAIDRASVDAACAGQDSIAVAGYVDASPAGLADLGHGTDDALVVVCREESDDVLSFISGAVEQRPERPVVVVFEGNANGFVRRAIDAGADDLVNGAVLAAGFDAGSQIAFALEKAVARRSGSVNGYGPRGSVGSIVTVLGPKGGTGKTLTACNLSVALAREGQRVVLVDLDLQFGDVGLALGMTPDRTIYDLAMSGGALDAEKLNDFLAPHESGVRVLLAPRRPDQASVVQGDFIRELLDALRTMTDYVVLDTPPSFSPEVITAIDKSNELCVVAMLDALSLKNTRLALDTLERMRIPESTIKVVLNRADSRVGVTAEDAAHLLGREPDVLIPSHRDITRSVNEAHPIVSGAASDARSAFESLARMFVPAGAGTDAPASTGRRSLLRRGKGS